MNCQARKGYIQADAVGATGHLDLCLGACGDVGDGPAGLLLDALLGAGGQQVQQVRQRTAVDDNLRLVVISGDDVAHRPQSRNQHGCLCVPSTRNLPLVWLFWSLVAYGDRGNVVTSLIKRYLQGKQSKLQRIPVSSELLLRANAFLSCAA